MSWSRIGALRSSERFMTHEPRMTSAVLSELYIVCAEAVARYENVVDENVVDENVVDRK